jgi:hypothetical protein
MKCVYLVSGALYTIHELKKRAVPLNRKKLCIFLNSVTMFEKEDKVTDFPPELPQPTFLPHFNHNHQATIFNQAHNFNL